MCTSVQLQLSREYCSIHTTKLSVGYYTSQLGGVLDRVIEWPTGQS